MHPDPTRAADPDQGADHARGRLAAPIVGLHGAGGEAAHAIGLANGELFHRIVALSPGFASPPGLQGRPEGFVSHGTGAEVLLIDRCSRRLVPWLGDAGYAVTWREFEGAHTIPPEIATEAVEWALRR